MSMNYLTGLVDYFLDGDVHSAPAPLEGGGGEVRGAAKIAGTGVEGATSGDVTYDPSTGQAAASGGSGGAFTVNMGPLGSVSIGGDANGSASGDTSSGSASGKVLGFISGNVLGNNFNLSEKLSGGFGW